MLTIPPTAKTPPTRHRLPRLLAGVALLLFLITLTLWIKSFWKGNGIGYTTYSYEGTTIAHWSIHDAEIICGSLIVGHQQTKIDDPRSVEASRHLTRGFYIYSPQPRYAYVGNLVRNSLANHLGFFIQDDAGRPGSTLIRLIIPGWFILLILATPNAWLLASAIRSRTRRAHGLCPQCGYDLRASPTQCPECGTPVPTQAEQKNRRA